MISDELSPCMNCIGSALKAQLHRNLKTSVLPVTFSVLSTSQGSHLWVVVLLEAGETFLGG